MNSSPQKTSPSETAKGFLLITLICTLLLLRFYQINSYIINDFDTSSILLGIQGGFYEGYGAFFDIAHPGLLSFWVFAGNIITNLYNSPPLYYWGTLLCLGVSISTLLIYANIINLGASRQAALIGCALYLSSPAISDISARSEENILSHPIFLLVIIILCNYAKKPKRIFLPALLACSALVAAQHLQPFLIICGGLFLFAFYSASTEEDCKREAYLKGLKLVIIFTLPGILYFLFAKFFLNLSTTNYATTYYSFFNNDSIYQYIKSFFLFLQGYLITGSLPFSWSANGVIPTTSVYQLGIAAALIIISLLAINRRLIDFISLAALGFVFLYEPSSSERWDTFIITAIIAISSINFKFDQKPNFFAQYGSTIFCITLLLANASDIKTQVINASEHNLSKIIFLEHTKGSNEIFTDLNNARVILNRISSEVRVLNILNLSAQRGAIIFDLKDASSFAGQHGINCSPIDSVSFCAVSR